MPVAPPPPGVIPNLVNPTSNSEMAIGLCSAIMGVMVLFVLLRFYIKGVVTKGIGLEDYMMNRPYFQRLIASQSLYPVVLLFTKLSILFLVYRLFKANRRAAFLVWFGIVANALFYGVTFVTTVVWCAPGIGGDPMFAASRPSCQTNAKVQSIVQAGYNIGSDLYLLIIPIPVVWRLKTTLAKRLRICVIFALGLLATILSALTLYYRVESLRTVDVSWVYVKVYITSIYELNLGVICACLPCIPALMKSERMQNFLSLRTWSLFSSHSTTNLFKRSRDVTKRSEYSDLEALKESKGTTIRSIELQQGSEMSSPMYSPTKERI
ncbi:hypothetical protein CC78DRAFT_463135 [Lojkania enalia]|uniref:Rhodopsin domain-containing protein n=1 Tax=Lojkania enalia TaxID=147567 RepID=A0A9P4N8G2_9PLEO|nr:hypothetical protein CC78DRAFT_463135 [Didymosphaeria enalia]